MFQPQPTPFASSFLAPPPYGLIDNGLDFDPPLLLPQQSGGRAASASFPGPAAATDAPAASAIATGTAPGPAGSPYVSHPPRHDHREPDRSHKHRQPQERRQQPRQQPSEPQQYSPALQMEDQDQHGLAAQEAAAKEYEPVFKGSLVGDKTPITAITQEYAKADPIYVEKTMTLPQSYSHYRPIRGDGNCGWRAIGFAYFEKLVEVGDQAQIEGEVARLTSLNHMIGSAGGYEYFEDFADEAIGLLREVAANISNPEMAHLLVQQRWNDSGTGSAIIYYLRLLTATYLKTNQATYAAFIADEGGVQAYCSQSVELPDREIEHIGVDALANVLLKPANFVLEVAYLDRTPGSEVNRYRVPGEANAQDPASLGPIIHLLFRPDHYDIIYRDPPTTSPPPMSVPVAPVSMQVNRVTGFSHDTQIHSTNRDLGAFATVDFSPLTMLPNFNPAGTGISPMASPPAPSPHVEQYFGSDTEDPWTAAAGQHFSPQAVPHQQQQQQQQPTPVLAPPPTPSASVMSPTSPMGTTPPMGGDSAMAASSRPGYSFRFSPHQLDYDESKSTFPESTFQVTTKAFTNSVYNRAHYGNPSFHPEEWRPEDDSIEGRMVGKRRVRKDS